MKRMNHVATLVMFIVLCTAARIDAQEPIVLNRANLEKLQGVWELKADPKAGWKGTVRAKIALHPKDGDAADFGYILFEINLADGANKLKVTDAPQGGLSFAVVKRGKMEALVASEEFAEPAPFKVEATEARTAIFELKDDKLTVDLSKSRKAFFPKAVREMQIDWSKATWEKIKK